MTEERPLPHLPVEPAFDGIVECAGGCRVDTLFEEPIAFENADYFFERPGVVAELKELTVDLAESRELSQRLGAILQKHAGKPGVPLVFGTAPVRIDLLPGDVRREMMQPFKRKLEGCVKKANRQIKETKKRLGRDDDRGLLILVNEANTMLRPDLAFFFLHHILSGQYSSIDQIVYCTVNLLVDAPGAPSGGRFWANGVIEDRKEIPPAFMQSLGRCYRKVLDEQTGVPGFQVLLDPEDPAPIPIIKPESDSRFYVATGEFYTYPRTGSKYYCSDVKGGTAMMWLLESWNNGQLIQAQFEQKLIHATREQYVRIDNADERKRLWNIARDLRKRE